MKRFGWTGVLCLWALLYVSAPAWGAGFLVFEQGTKAMGMAGAFTATADDPSALFNNPAGITQLPGSQVAIGNTFIRNDQKYDVASDQFPLTYHEEMQSKTFFLPHLYVTQQLSDNITLGFAFNSPFGIGTNWKDSSVGNGVADEAHLKTYDFNPNIAFKLSPRLSAAVGVHYTRLKTQIIRKVGLADLEGSLPVSFTPVSSWELLNSNQLGRSKLDARGGGWAYNVGLLYRFNEFWKAGFSYRSDTKVEVSPSEATFDLRPSSNTLAKIGGPPVNPFGNTHVHGKTRINLPGIFLAGIATTRLDGWTIELDVQYTTWNHFDDIEIEVEPAVVVGGVPQDTLSTLQEDWENTWGFHLGTEYKYTDNFAVRAGYFFDKNPIPDRTLGPILPDSDRHNFSLGCGYTRGDWTLDGAYMWSNFENRSTDSNYQDFNGSFKTNFHLLGFTLTKRL